MEDKRFLTLCDAIDYCFHYTNDSGLVVSKFDAETIEIVFKVSKYSNFFGMYQLCEQCCNVSLKMTTDGNEFMIYLRVEHKKPF